MNQDLLKKFKDGTAAPDSFLDIVTHVSGQIAKIQDCIHNAGLGEWATPDQSYDKLFGPPIPTIEEYNARVDSTHPSPSKRVRLSDKAPSLQDLHYKINDLKQSLD